MKTRSICVAALVLCVGVAAPGQEKKPASKSYVLKEGVIYKNDRGAGAH